jgi:curli production assembly/transport component CsgF
MGKTTLRIVCVAGALGLLTPAFATEQVYHPISPTFGGNPTNGPFLLSVAQGQGEGVNSGNQGPNLTGLTNALSNLGSGSTSTGATTAGTTSSVANPLSSSARMP